MSEKQIMIQVRSSSGCRLFVLGTLAWLVCGQSARSAGPPQKEIAHADLFTKPIVVNLQLKVSTEGMASLRAKPREWVRANVIADGEEFPETALHLKGVTSFLPLDKKPSFTLSFGKYVSGRRLFGMRKLHLNNSVQDSSFMCDDLASELFRRAGVPAARTAWARVHLNERDLGLYVLKEGFAEELLKRYFANTDGNLYECGTHQDIFDPLERDSGRGCADHSDLKALYAASQIPDATARWEALSKLLDINGFISMMAMESLTGHIDGYSQMQNNFRVYFDPTSGRATFMVTGLDQMFGNPEAPLEPTLRAALSLAITGTPEGESRYRARLRQLAEKVFQPEWMSDRIDAAIKTIEPVDPVAARDARLMKGRVMARVAFVRKTHAATTMPAPASN